MDAELKRIILKLAWVFVQQMKVMEQALQKAPNLNLLSKQSDPIQGVAACVSLHQDTIGLLACIVGSHGHNSRRHWGAGGMTAPNCSN